MAITGQELFAVVSGSAQIYNAWSQYFGDPKTADVERHIYVGVVEDTLDPWKKGRVKVRIHGIHTDDLTILPTSDLNWQLVMLPTTSPSISGVGCNPFLVNGSTVIMIPDSMGKQQFLVIGTLPTKSYGDDFDTSKGFCDPKLEFPRGKDTSDLNTRALGGLDPNDSSQVFSPFNYEIDSSYNPVYPYNHVTETESGHVIELDDTPASERISVRHKSGTGYEIHPTGTMQTKVVKDNYTMIVGDDTIEVKGSVNIIVSENVNITCAGNIDASVGGNIFIKAENAALIDINGILDIHTGDNITINTAESAYITAEKDIFLRTKPNGYCNGDTSGEYVTQEACEAAGSDWVTLNEANIVLQSWDNIYMSAKNGEIVMEAKNDITLNSKTKNVITKAGIDVNINADKDVNIHSGAKDWYCSDSAYTNERECIKKGVCYIDGSVDPTITNEKTCTEDLIGIWVANTWIKGKDGNVNIEGEEITIQARQRDEICDPDNSADGCQSGAIPIVDSQPVSSTIKITKDTMDLDSKKIDLNKNRLTS